ncbi:hypothetical protein K435DRAFT_959844 [Dendrothele bispora CBS 962.96]|uniref:ABM domain-containing protein n=1 Tax=Dendrothele bispora (strain CBS 962.96) TaxID=1314807 RepID=A0A4S8MVS0_DENBC|nr:hypothetical protein K435DRAFT_959844 [Dendrothele bispora CBS 962.96]
MNLFLTCEFHDQSSSTPSGKLLIVAILGINPGHEDKIHEILKIAKEDANSDKEPKTLTYRTGRSISPTGQPQSEFVVIEEYADAKVGLMEHAAGRGSVALLKAREEGAFSSFNLNFYDEF